MKSFLKHLEQGGAIPIENLPVIQESSGTIKMFSIDYKRHKNFYNFENPSQLIHNFFSVVDIKFQTDGQQEYIITSSFCIRSSQPPPEDINNVTTFFDKRVWSTEMYSGKYFNNYRKYSLTSDIKKRIISNTKTRSFWRFNKFDSISATFNSIREQNVIRER